MAGPFVHSRRSAALCEDDPLRRGKRLKHIVLSKL